MARSVLIVLLFTAISIQCGREGELDELDDRFMNSLGYQAAYNSRVSPPPNHRVFDPGDGSIRVETLIHGDPGYAPALRVNILRKCPQGFLHEESDNSCYLDPALGGSDPELAKLRYCDEATNACNDLKGFLIGAGSSPAHAACAGETALGVQWRVASIYAVTQVMIDSLFPVFYPDLNKEFVWLNETTLAEKAYIHRRDIGTDARAKTEKHFVLCERTFVEDES